jgi:hypothetical protein
MGSGAAMLDKRDGTPVVDLAVLVASPALIMLMVGSLVWFLVDVLRPTQYPDRLLWCLSFFVFGAVLLARLTIEHGSSYAAIYTVFLAGATFLAMIRFVDYPGDVAGAVGAAVSLALMALTWWLANRLTWDCTHLDEDRRTSGRGLLAAAGWDGAPPDEPDTDDAEEAAKPRKKDSPGLMGWLERLWRYREARRRRPHTPGTWVLYFGLAALPLFALGQSLVPAGDADRRRATLMEAAVFVGSGLGLLVTTSLMGLRRYLEQRDARVPVAMTAGWLGLGAGLIGLFVVAAAVLPRPHSEVPWIDLKSASKSDRQASRNAVLRDNSAGKGEGASGQKKEAGSGKASAPGGKKEGGSAGEKGQGGGKGDSQGQGKQSGGKQGKGDGQGKDSGGNQKGEGKDQPAGKDNAQGEKSQESSGDQSNDGDKSTDGEKSDSADANGGSESSLSGPSRVAQQAFEVAGSVLKWVVWAVIAVAVVVGLVMFALKGLAPFTDWAKNLLAWLQGLFARKPRGSAAGGDEPAEDAGPRRVPFGAFSNPFTDGTARRRTPADLATYTLSALDAWAGDHGAGRRPGETPGEFAARLGDEFPRLDAAGRAADLAVRALYSRRPLPADAPKALAALWKQLDGPAG